MLYFGFLITALIVFAVIILLVKNKTSDKIPVVILASSFVIIITGLLLAVNGISQINESYQKRNWPQVEAAIISSKVLGDRAFYPEVVYQYFVDTVLYIDTTNLNVPMFGGKRKKYDVAAGQIKLYPPGKKIAVYLDPNDYSKSFLNPNPKWTEFGKSGFGLFLILLGLIGILLNRKKIKSTDS